MAYHSHSSFRALDKWGMDRLGLAPGSMKVPDVVVVRKAVELEPCWLGLLGIL